MKKTMKRILSFILCLAMFFTMLPTSALAAESNPEKLEIDDGYLKVTVSGKNGGFLIDTVKGNKLDKADDNKNLLFPAADFDTSYTSFQVTRKNGTMEEYIFGRKYGFLGLATRDVVLTREGNAIVATWGVRDLTVKQTLTLLDETASLHGMVNISYTVSTTGDDIDNVKMRVMYDTALGFQDYAIYEVPNRLNEYTHVIKDTVIDNSGENEGDYYSGTLFAVDNEKSPTITAYTVDATLEGETISPYQMAFGHWNNLASSVFDFVPKGITFTNAYNQEYMTADSAYAMYYDLGAIGQNEEKSFATYYGVYSNATLREEETVAINFPVLPAPMELKGGSSSAYVSQVENGADGDIHLKMMLENISGETYEKVTVVVEPMNKVYPYEDYLYYPDVRGEEGEPIIEVIDDFKYGEEVIIDSYFNVEPLIVSEYRRFKVLVYNTTNGDELTDARLVGSREFYLFCPGELGETIVFNNMDPDVIYYEGTRDIYVSGLNFALLKDTTAYTAVLHSLSGGSDVVVPGTNVVVDTNSGTVNLVVDETMEIGTYQVIFDWIDPSKEDATSDLLRFQVTDDLSKVSATYGVVTVEKAADYTEDNPTYAIGLYKSEEEYQAAIKNKTWDLRPYLEFRGNFGVRRENGQIVEVRANSLTDIFGNPLSTINISNCLDVECGMVALRVENPGEDDQVINIDIDGKVYTTNARTSVWDGVCAITSFADGDMSTMLEYNYEGVVQGDIENSVANTNGITLLWPGAASTMQTIAGMFFEFNYCQFGYMALEQGTVTPETDRMRIISFGAELSPDFLIPSNYDWGGRQTSAMDVAQMTLAKQNYTSDQLRNLQDRFAQDQQAFLDAQRGSLSLYVTDILFGGGFAGFNTTIEVETPEYGDVLPSLNGTLSLKVLPATMYRDGRIWEFGIAGSTELMMIHVEGSFGLKETPAGVPAIDKFYCFADGGVPGINLDGVGVFWLTGVGGGMSNIYNSMFVVSKVPPMALTIAAGFRLFQIMSAKASVKASLRGFDAAMTNIGIAGVDLIDKIGFSLYWYPELKLRGDMYLDILDIISAGGYIVVEENQETGDIFWEAFATGSVQTPDIGIIPGIEVGSVDLGVNASKVWGALHVLKLDMGVTYYWGGDVNFAFGKYDAPESTYPLGAMAVGEDPATGRVLYMSLGTNAILSASSDKEITRALNEKKLANTRASLEPSIESTADNMTHIIDLGAYEAGRDILLNITFKAETKQDAEWIAKGNGLTAKGISLNTEDDSATYPLVWLDNSKPADEQPDANALFAYNENTKTGTISISFTEESFYDTLWKLNSDVETTLALYHLNKLPGLDSVSYTYAEQSNIVTITDLAGYELNTIGEVDVYAVDTENQQYFLGTVSVVDPDAHGLKLPVDLPSGTYTIRVAANNDSENICSTADAADSFTFVNALQPEDPTISSIGLGGDYTLDVDVVSGSKPIDGYRTTIYEKDGDQWIAVEDFSNVIVEADADNQSGSLTLGGSYTTMNYVDAQGNLLTYAEAKEDKNAQQAETIHALEAGKTYRVGIATYQNDVSGLPVYSGEVISDEVTMVAPDPAEVTVQAVGAKAIGSVIDPSDSTIDVVTNAQVSFQIRSDMAVSGSWSLDGGVQTGIWNAANSGTITLAEDVAEGEHMLTLTGENAAGDGLQVQYRFRVDCSGPALQISAPVNGQVFGRSDNDYAKETVHVVGLSEPDTTVIVALEGTETAKITVDETGSFSIPVVLDETKLDQTLTVYGVDAAGNQSAVKSFHLNNAITGAEGLYLAIYLNGQDVTNEVLPAGSMGDVELRFVAGDQSVVIPETSEIGRQIEWDMSVLDGTITLEDDQLFTDPSAHGLLQANYGLMNATVVFGEEDLEEDNQITFAVADGYTLHTDESMMVPYGQDFHFTVEIAEGYTATEDFAVMANGVVLTADNGVYTIAEVYAPKYVEVVGVADITAPTASVTVVDNTWRDFLNTISFGIFFKESQTATITAQDTGSGVKEVFYYISETQLTLDQVKAIETWAAYTGSFTLDPDRSAVIYVKAVDHAGNIVYISSDGMVFDATAPVITNIQDGGSYYGDQTFQVVEKYLDTLKVDGQVVSLTDSSFVIPADNEEHIIELTDKAGNQARYTVTVYKIYTVTFVADGQTIDTAEVNHGAGLAGTEFPAIPGKTGYDQTAPVWTVDGQPVTELTNVTGDVTVTAAYTINTYEVTLPAEMIGYTIVCGETTGIEHGSQFTFQVEITEGYVTAAEFAVYVNGEKVTAEAGIYTVVMTEDISITVEGVKDVAAPTGEIAVVNHRWKEFLNTITFGIFFKESQTVTITAADAGSGVNAIYYCLSDQILTEEEVEAIEGWITYHNGFTLNPDNKYVVYAKLVDNAGNVCYISSDGMVFDATVPVIDGIQNGGSYYGDQTFTVIEEYLNTVKVDGQNVTLTEGKFVIPADNEEHTIVLTDKAGNVTEYTVTVYKIYTVTFVADGQTVATVPVNHGAGMAAGTLPQIPGKVGYDQTAPVWTVDGEIVTELTNVTSDMTVTAVYTINTYTVTFMADGNMVDTVEVEHGSDVLAAQFPEIPAKVGYDQTAPVWTVNGQTVTELTNVTGDVTVAAVYTINTYTVTFVAEGQIVGTVEVEHGSDVLAAQFPEIPAKDGANEFEPVWTVNGQTVTELTEVTGDIIVTARYQANVYTVTFMADGNMVDTVEVEHGGDVLSAQFPEIPVKVGYDQTAPVWTVEGQIVTELTNVTGDVTVTAAYTINTYTVTFMADGQQVGTVTVEHGGDVESAQFPEIPAKEGYDQTAPVWTVTGETVTELTNVTGDMTVTAAYTVNTYTVTFMADGQQVGTVTVEHGGDVQSAQFPVIPAKEGYDQTAPVWTVEGQTVTELINVIGDMTLTAAYTINKYTVTFVADGQTVGTVEVEHGGDVLAAEFPEIPAKEGADEFEPVWTVNGQSVTELINVTGDVIVTARYQANVYTVTFMADGNMIGTVEVEHGGSVPATQFPEIPAKEGYDQSAPVWTVEGQTVTELTNVTGDVTVTAAYTINTYTVTFVIEGETVDTVEVEHGATVLAAEFPEIPAKEGYDQTAPVWTVEGQTVTQLNGVTGDVTVTAVYTINTYTVTFVIEGETVDTVEVEHGADILAAEFPEIPAKEGYDQTAPVWTVEGQTVSELTNVTGDVTVTAVYTINTYTVTFMADGQVVDTVEVEHGSDVLAAQFPEIPAKVGYDQTAPVWTVDGQTVSELTNVTGDVTVTAVYTINTYTVTFMADGQVVDTVEVEHGSDVLAAQFPEIPAKVGYDQTAPVWTVEGQTVGELTNVTGDVTVTAAYTINTYTVTFVADGQTIATVEVEHGSDVLAAQFPEIPAKTGYDQTAPVWAVEGQTVTELTNVTGDVTVTAAYTINTYTVTFVADGQIVATMEVEHGGSVLAAQFPEIPVKDGADEFEPVWTVNGQTVSELTNVTGDVIVTARYQANSYIVTFMADGNMVATVEVEHGSDVLAAQFPEIPAKEGYDQNAPVWTVDGEVVTELTNVTSDMTVTAVYTINTYKVTFVADGQPVGTVEVEHGSDVQSAQFPEIPAKVGYDQTAPVWTVEGQTVTELTNVTGDVTVTAAYTINTYTVTFVADGQTVGTVEVEHGSSVSGAQFPEIPVKVGYDQTAPVWTVEGQTVTELANVTADVTVTAVYTINTYDVTLPDEMIGYTITGGTTTDLEHGAAYTFQITVADGYSATEDFAVYANGVKLTAEGSSYTVVMTEDVIITVEGIKDVTAPELTVTVETNIWREFLNTITFGLFFKETQEAELTATDLGSGIHGMYYLISSHAIALDDLANAGWTQYTGKVKLDADGHYVVYAKAVDNAGNVTYVNSNGLVIDTIAPSVEGIVDGGVYEGEVTFTVTDENIDTVTINGTPVNEMVVTLSPAEEPYTIVIMDKAGNETRLTITVNEKPEEPPVCDGGEGCPGHGFSDLDPNAWYHEGVDFVLESGLMNGYPDHTFGPEDILTRSMFVQVLYNLEGRPAVSGQDAYTDTVEGAWYTDAVLWASQNGIVNGYGNGLFGPDDAVSREQMATMFYRYSQLKGYSLTEGNYDHFPDKADVSDFAEAAMRWAVGNGLLMGMGDGTLAPLEDSTRVEFVTLIQRFVETIVE